MAIRNSLQNSKLSSVQVRMPNITTPNQTHPNSWKTIIFQVLTIVFLSQMEYIIPSHEIGEKSILNFN